jgi:hypothetical protein
VHNSIPEYASTTNILKPFEKKVLKKLFSPQISSKPPEYSRDGACSKKREEKRKAPKVS